MLQSDNKGRIANTHPQIEEIHPAEPMRSVLGLITKTLQPAPLTEREIKEIPEKIREIISLPVIYWRNWIMILIACRALDEGIDVPQASIGIILAGTGMERQGIISGRELGISGRNDKEVKTEENMFSAILSKQSKIAVGITVGFLCLVLLPLFAIAHFNYPCTDDFAFADVLYEGIRKGGSIGIIIQGAWGEAINYYKNWQGCYFNNALSSFGIGIAVPKFYFWGTYLVIILFVTASICFLRTFTYQICRWDINISWILAILIIAMQILYVPYPSEAFYWYVGATVYTMTYALLLFLGTALIYFYSTDSHRKRLLLGSVSALLVFMIGGSNYSTGLLTAEILVVALSGMLLKKKKCRFLCIIVLEYMICFVLFNALAPSNAGRMGAVESLGVAGSILASLHQGAVFLKEWFRLPVVLLLVIIFLLGASQVVRMNFSFRLPAVVTVISFGLFCSMMTPPYYAGATWGPGRLINLVYFSYYFLLSGNLLYWTGWAARKYEKFRLVLKKELGVLPVLLSFFVLLLVCLKIYGLQSTSSSSALISLVKGEAAEYLRENEIRWEIYTDDSIIEAEVEDFSVKPYVLYHDDIVEDKTDWRNVTVANFFGKDSVRLKR